MTDIIPFIGKKMNLKPKSFFLTSPSFGGFGAKNNGTVLQIDVLQTIPNRYINKKTRLLSRVFVIG
jgi:hypothetical protein